MHARQLVELAALAAEHGLMLIRGGHRPSLASMTQYWAASKCRLDRWARMLKSHASPHDLTAFGDIDEGWPVLRPVLEEILVSEVLTRVWTAVVRLCEKGSPPECDPLARSVLLGHQEARNRALHLMVRARGLGIEAAVELNHLRRRCESWSDLLLGRLAAHGNVSELAFEPERVGQFAEDLEHERREGNGNFAWPLTRASLRGAFETGLWPMSPNPDLNSKIASGVLSSFPADLFDSTGVFQTLWQVRLTNAAKDTQGMLEELLAVEEPEVAASRYAVLRRK